MAFLDKLDKAPHNGLEGQGSHLRCVDWLYGRWANVCLDRV